MCVPECRLLPGHCAGPRSGNCGTPRSLDNPLPATEMPGSSRVFGNFPEFDIKSQL